MTTGFFRGAAGTLGAATFAAVLVGGAGPAAAQEASTNRVGANTDWSLFVEGSPQECWAVSAPKEMVATRDGNPVSVRRDDPLMFVTWRPAQNVASEVSYTGGYPFAPDSTVSLDIGGTRFDLYVDGTWAYAAPEQDAAIVAAMKAGASAVLVARSARGNTTTDTFSLLGFTATVDEAARRCAG
jgi:hypothetical protein